MVATSDVNHVFISGKNWKLSLAELVSFLQERKIIFAVREFSREFFAVSVNAHSDELAIDSFGGIIKIGIVKSVLPTEVIKRFFVKKEKSAKNQIKETIASSGFCGGVLSKAIGKPFFGISVYSADRSLRGLSYRIQRFVGSSIKAELEANGLRSDFMGFSSDRMFPQLTHVEVIKKQLVEKEAEMILCIGREQTLIATTTAVHDPFEFQKRDVGKPVERRIFAMPPRLARTMVNLAGCTPGKTFLDPFCGVGTILLEALLSRARIVGVDSNPWCVKATKENLEWLAGEYELREADFAVFRGDARKLSPRLRNVDCIATEPDLGPALRQVPTGAYATKVYARLEPSYLEFLEDANRVLNPNGRLVIVTPFFQTRSGEPIPTRFAEKAEQIGFKRIFPFKKDFFVSNCERERNLVATTSLVDVAERHKVGREIHVFQKQG